MKKRYIYHDSNLRCRIKKTGYKNQVELRIQKRYFIFWINVHKWMHVSEGFWGECERFPTLISSYQYGNVSECYMTGTLDLNARVDAFFNEYFDSITNK